MNTAILSRAFDRRLFLVVAVGVVLIVFTSFARMYFLRGFFIHDPLPLLLRVHGAVMFAWFALFLVQTCLIETHRVDISPTRAALGHAPRPASGPACTTGRPKETR